MEGCQQELRVRVDNTLDAAAGAVNTTLRDYVNTHLLFLEARLFPEGQPRFR